MSTQIEARRLSGEHVGQRVTVLWPEWCSGPIEAATGMLQSRREVNGQIGISVRSADGIVTIRHLAPHDLVTIHDDRRTTTPTPKETL